MAAKRLPSVRFTPKLAGEILRRIAEGESLYRICGPGRARGMPDRMTVHKWLRRHEGLRRGYQLARLAQADLWADEVVWIADGGDGEGEPDLERDKLRCAVRRWLVGVSARACSIPPATAQEPRMSDLEFASRIVAILEGTANPAGGESPANGRATNRDRIGDLS